MADDGDLLAADGEYSSLDDVDRAHESGSAAAGSVDEVTLKKSLIKDLVTRAPRDFWVVMCVVFLENLSYFATSYVLVVMLEDEFMMDDVEATMLYALFGIATSVYLVCFGWLVDLVLVKKSFLIQSGLAFGGRLMIGLFPSRTMVYLMVLIPVAFALSIGSTAMLVGVRRYTTQRTRNIAFSLRYVVMNVGALIASPLADAVRVGLVPALKSANLPGYSSFVMMLAALHLISFSLVFFLLRDVYVDEDALLEQRDEDAPEEAPASQGVVSKKWQLKPVPRQHDADSIKTKCHRCCRQVGVGESIRSGWSAFRSKMTLRLLGFMLLSLSTLGAKSVFRYMDSLYPLWMARAAYPAEDATKVPYMSFLMLNPIIVLIGTTPLATFMERRNWHPYWVIVVGTAIAACAPFWMMWVQYVPVFFFIIQLSLGEIMWSPMVSTYSCWFAPEGQEGFYFALAAIPVFGAKALSGYLSGQVLSTWCPPPPRVPLLNETAGALLANSTLVPGLSETPCSPVVWLVVGCFAASSPVFILMCMKCVRVDRPTEESPLKPAAADDIELREDVDLSDLNIDDFD